MLEILMIGLAWDFIYFVGKDGANVALLLLNLPKPHFFATIATPRLHTRGLCIDGKKIWQDPRYQICDIFSTKNNQKFFLVWYHSFVATNLSSVIILSIMPNKVVRHYVQNISNQCSHDGSVIFWSVFEDLQFKTKKSLVIIV